MNPITPTSQQLSQVIDSLPEDARLELANLNTSFLFAIVTSIVLVLKYYLNN